MEDWSDNHGAPPSHGESGVRWCTLNESRCALHHTLLLTLQFEQWNQKWRLVIKSLRLQHWAKALFYCDLADWSLVV